MSHQSLAPEQLRRRCDPEQFGFTTTTDIPDIDQIIGQQRAVDAIRFGLGIRREGYNLFVLGPAGVGKHTAVSAYLRSDACSRPVPDDWVYVNCFRHTDKPRALRLPTGMAQTFCRDMERLVDDLQHAMPVAFESAEYHARVEEIEQGVKERREQAIRELAAEAESHEISLLRTPKGFSFAPMVKGEVVTSEQFDKLPEEKRAHIEEVVAVLQERLGNILLQLPKWQREARDKVRGINRDIAISAVAGPVGELKRKYEERAGVVRYLDEVEQDIIDHADDFLSEEESSPFTVHAAQEVSTFRRYQVNVLVDHGETSGAPVVYEDTPAYDRLVGRVEHRAHMGALFTDFMMIKPGALHRANGGYLILDAGKLLQQPYAWEGLKRALRSRELVIQSLGQIFSMISTTGLDPEPIPLDLKVVLLGEPLLFYLLQEYDPEFAELFKVAADFDDSMDRDDSSQALYAHLIAKLCREHELLPFDRNAVARVIEQGSRLAEDAGKLSTHMLNVSDLLREADYWAHQAGRTLVTVDDIEIAIERQEERAGRIRDRVHEDIERGTILIDTDGAVVAQVNGLSVIDLGNLRFAQPFRITATARLGEGEVIDIEREVELGGAIHSKGVLILSSYLAARYAHHYPLSLRASVVFEQSYGEVEGDSASVGELCALLSAVSGVAIMQSLAVTGSVNQHGRVQPIGGVNEKIEGFFDVCRKRGLNGSHGVIIPQANVIHLMLKNEVVQAVAAGQFRVYAVEHVDQVMELLTGTAAGERDAQGAFPDGSVNALVEQRLSELAMLRHDFVKSTGDDGLGHAAGEDDGHEGR